ncbi:pyroglutamyl-peptidase I [Planosporangium flavigriseum]|uniref:Pyrrolidone-carboxylate peptidase n=1 Tax=Planosporangium flavigriseum TaxID=373681 RepID=A0A8J3LYJ2_9ACTN|nr:pyroglutamyl-peptidase I [Planosporangium flavigriseum]NJC65436.1 pyroglutamyl-peptidase I [Planosporangium flavigriseum]GIG75876.1 pyrrolidone-carboxylate peptidase [Planosporangium flavigriseum]
MIRVLLTGFAPFDGASLNPSWEAARLAAAAPLDGFSLTAVELPCVFGDSIAELYRQVARVEPDIVLAVGLASGRTAVSVERVAVNVDDARIPDNAGNQPIDTPVVPGGPAAYFSTLPIKACVEAVRAAGIPAEVSPTAGSYVCNHVFYGLMHLLATERPATRGGFVHMPCAPGQVLDGGLPCLPVPAVAEALRLIAATTATVDTDARLAAGTIH